MSRGRHSSEMRVWRGYLLFAAAATALYAGLPDGVWKGDVLYDGFGLASVAALLAGIRRNRPAQPLPWLLFAAGQALFVLGDGTFSLYEVVLHASPFPSAADGVYLAGYPVLAAGLLLLVRRTRPGEDWPSLLTGGMVTVALGSLSWALLMEPYTRDRSLSPAALAISLAYPLGDVLLLAVAAHLLFGGGSPSPSRLLIGASLAAMLVADSLYGWLSLHGRYQTGSAVDLGWLASYALFALAALHPSMGAVTDRVQRGEASFGPWRSAALAAALATVPVGVAVSGAQRTDRLMFAGAGILLIGLGVTRLAGVIRANERAARSEAVLRRAASSLVRAADREAVLAAAARSALDLLEDPDGVALVASGPLDRLALSSTCGSEAAPAAGLPLSLPADVTAALGDGSTVELAGRLLVADGRAAAVTSVCALTAGARVHGILAVQSTRRAPPSFGSGLGVLAGQAALALEAREAADEAARLRGEERFRSLVQNAADLILVVAPDLEIRYQTPSVEAQLGYPEQELQGRMLDRIVHPADVAALRSLVAAALAAPGSSPHRELRLRRSDGAELVVEAVAGNLLADPVVAGIVITARDVGEHRELERQLRQKAFEDGLTGLANGELFRNRLQHALARRSERAVAVVVLDLDDFQDVNDGLGHAVGDALLVETAARLQRALRVGDTAARLGGDEFAILLDDLDDPAGAAPAAERMLAALGTPFVVDGAEVRCSVSAGIAVAAPGDSDPQRLLQQADLAMYQAKRSGKARAAHFDATMEDRVLDRLQRVGELRRALDREELLLHYQPVLELATGDVAGLEALVRWRRPGRGLVPPSEFVPLAEETGLIVPIGRWALGEACRQAQAWQLELPDGRAPWVSVNVSVRQLEHSWLGGDVDAALAGSGLAPEQLVLELTESALSDDADAMLATLGGLKARGIRLAIDDFGTGYSSLSYVRRLPVDILKLDRQFVADLDGNRAHEEIAATVLRLARVLRLDVVAEGIEEPSQAERLRRLDCALGQGYLLAPPLPAEEASAFIAARRLQGAAVA